MLRLAWLIYGIGALVGAVRTDARWPARVGLALLWPLGPLAFLGTVGLLLAVSLVAFPIWGAIVVGAAALAALLLR